MKARSKTKTDEVEPFLPKKWFNLKKVGTQKPKKPTGLDLFYKNPDFCNRAQWPPPPQIPPHVLALTFVGSRVKNIQIRDWW